MGGIGVKNAKKRIKNVVTKTKKAVGSVNNSEIMTDLQIIYKLVIKFAH